jgi:GntR family transcriptional repressor for pyruvate dehydrogenase complex
MDDAGLERLRRHVDAMREAGSDRTRFIEADLKFHLEVAQAADNQVLSGLLRSIRSLLRVWVERGIQSDAEAADALAEHTAVLEAIATRDPDKAAAAMQHHMRTAGARLERRIQG